MNTYEIIKTLANGRKMTVAELERKLDLSNGSISKYTTRIIAATGFCHP